MGKICGVFDYTNYAIYVIVCYLDFPDPPPVFGCTDKIAYNI
jgi:hypothetical protein